MRSLARTLLALAVVALGSSAGASVLNGDFATPVPSNATGGDWTSSNIDGSGGWQAGGGSFDAHFILNQAGEAGTDPTLEQTLLGLTIGASYRVEGQFEGVFTGFGSPTAASFGVEVVGVALLELQRPTGVGSFSLEFVATSTSHVLRLTGERNGDDSSYRVDNIRLVPEPATAALLASALACAWAPKRRHP